MQTTVAVGLLARILLHKQVRVAEQKGVEEDIQSLLADLKSMDAVLLEIEAASPADQLHKEMKKQYEDATGLTFSIEQWVNKFMAPAGSWHAHAIRSMFNKFMALGSWHAHAIRSMFNKFMAPGPRDTPDIPSVVNFVMDSLVTGSLGIGYAAPQFDDHRGHIRDFKDKVRKLREWFDDHRLLISAADTPDGLHVQVKDDIVKKLRGGGRASKGQLNIASIHGPPGVGKTTIAAQVYTELEPEFELRAWVTVPTNPDIQEILRSILRQISPKDPGPIDKKDIIQAIIEALEDKRYFLIIDNICEIRAWAIIKRALTEDCNGSAVLTTTCSAEIAGYVSGGHKLETLNDDCSIKLFNQRLFGSQVNCPLELKDISREIACTCRGRPLDIIIAAGLLAVKPPKEEDWRSVLDPTHATKFFESFSRLSPDTRSCLLYLSLFQKGYEIGVDRLIWGWIAEGFAYEQDGMTSQEMGEEYLTELKEEGFIEVVEVDAVGKALSCRVHDRMHEVLVACSAKLNFTTILDGERQGSSKPISVNYRLSIQGNKIDPPLKEGSLSHVKSLVVSGDGNLLPSLSNFMGLRVFELEGRDSLQELKGIGSLSRLRCLVMGSTFSSSIPEEIGKLVLLQTLDLRATNLKELPQSVFQISQLRRLCVNSRTKIPDGIGKMVNLEELGDININKPELLKKLRKLTKLRVLRIAVWSSDEKYGNELLKYLCSLLKKPKKEKKSPRQAIQSLSILTCCSVHFWDKSYSRQKSQNPIDLSLPKLEIRHSKFHSFPRWICSIEKLSSLSIEVYTVSQEIIDMLGKFQHLKSLSLTSTSKSSADPVGRFRKSSDAFGKLASFRIVSNAMGEIFEKEGAMPNLRRFTLSFEASRTIDVSPAFYFGLENLPSSVKHVRVEIICSSASPRVVEKAEAVIRQAIEKSGNTNKVIVEIRRILEKHMVKEDEAEQIAKESPDESSIPALPGTSVLPNANKTDEVRSQITQLMLDDIHHQLKLLNRDAKVKDILRDTGLNKDEAHQIVQEARDRVKDMMKLVLEAECGPYAIVEKMDHSIKAAMVDDFDAQPLNKEKGSEKKMDHDSDTDTVEDFNDRSLEKAKCSKSNTLDDPLPSPTISTSSMVLECSESIGSESKPSAKSKSSKELSQGSTVIPRAAPRLDEIFVRGEHWVSEDELEEAGKEAKSLHDLYLHHCRDTESNIDHIPMKIPEEYHCHDEFGSSRFNIFYENIFHLYNFQMLDMSMIRLYSILLQKKAEVSRARVGIMDPLLSHATMLKDNPKELSQLIRDVWDLHKDKQFILMPYNPPGHWVLLIICPASNTVLYLDSLKRKDKEAKQYFAGITGVIDRAFWLLRTSGGGTCSNNGSTKLSHHFNFPAMKQLGNTECGYFVCAHMDEVINNLDWLMSEDSLRKHIVSKEASFDYLQKMWTIRETLIRFLVDEVVKPTGEFCWK